MELGLYRQAHPLNSVFETVLLLEIKFLIRKEVRVLISWEEAENFQLTLSTLAAGACCSAALWAVCCAGR